LTIHHDPSFNPINWIYCILFSQLFSLSPSLSLFFFPFSTVVFAWWTRLITQQQKEKENKKNKKEIKGEKSFEIICILMESLHPLVLFLSSFLLFYIIIVNLARPILYNCVRMKQQKKNEEIPAARVRAQSRSHSLLLGASAAPFFRFDSLIRQARGSSSRLAGWLGC
jgi:hypothetical protein